MLSLLFCSVYVGLPGICSVNNLISSSSSSHFVCRQLLRVKSASGSVLLMTSTSRWMSRVLLVTGTSPEKITPSCAARAAAATASGRKHMTERSVWSNKVRMNSNTQANLCINIYDFSLLLLNRWFNKNESCSFLSSCYFRV